MTSLEGGARVRGHLASLRRAAAPYLPVLRRTALLALACNLGLELFRLAGVDGYPWRFKSPTFPLMFLVGTVVVWMVVGLVHAVVGRWWLTRALVVALTVLVALVDYEKVRLRREPLYPADIAFLGDLDLIWGMVGIRSLVLTVLGALFLGAVLVVTRRRALRKVTTAQPAPGSRTRQLLLRGAAAGLCLLGLLHAAAFNEPGNVARGAYEAFGATWRPWSQQRNYLGNGFVAGVLYNTDVPAMPRPPGYGPEKMAAIAARYADEAERINRVRTRPGLEGVNVVMVLSESFSDPTMLRGVEIAEDPIPYTRDLMRRTTSGRMLAHSIGGGTANMEFEAMTGMSLSQFPAQLRVPYQMLVPNTRSFPSTVEWFEHTGHRTVAVHPYTTEMYRRRDVYRAFGFDDFVHEDRLHGERRIGHDAYVSDSTAFSVVTRELRDSEASVFANVVTMQNHIPYDDRYDDPIPVTGPDGESMPETGQYLRGLTHSDAALRDLVGELENLDEPTVLVMYGDHLPGTYPDAVHQANGSLMKQTPFLVWSNFPAPRIEERLVSPTHFTDLLVQHADSAVTPYLALLTRLREEVPAMDATVLYDDQGRRIARDRLSPRAARLLEDYRLVQYDLAVGGRYSEDVMLDVRPNLGATEAAPAR
jgi:phosphoglycerol transferase MdoB-like AlkP superfamily enzyme